MYWIQLVLEAGLLIVFAYESFLASKETTDEILHKQNRLKFFAAPLGLLLMILLIVMAFIHDKSYFIGVALLLIIIIISSTAIPKAFKNKKPTGAALLTRNLLMAFMFIYDVFFLGR